MKNIKNQSGSAVLIAIIILAVALLGAVGYIAYQEFSKSNEPEAVEVEDETTVETTVVAEPETTVETTVATTTPTTVATTTTVSNTKTGNENFAITQWGVTGHYESSYPAEYLIATASRTGFTSSALTGRCAGETVGSIHRLAAEELYPSFDSTQTVSQLFISGNETQKSNIKHIGSYYYVYVSPQAACVQAGSTTADPIFVSLGNSIRDYFSTLVAV